MPPPCDCKSNTMERPCRVPNSREAGHGFGSRIWQRGTIEKRDGCPFKINPSRQVTLARSHADHQNYATWPSNSPSFGMFFSCCGVIFAESSPPSTPRGPRLSASDLVLREPCLLGIIARHLSPPQSLSALSQSKDNHRHSNRCSWSDEQRRKALVNPERCFHPT
jgi:hypothetical protein